MRLLSKRLILAHADALELQAWRTRGRVAQHKHRRAHGVQLAARLG
jgi:hypothetical protein